MSYLPIASDIAVRATRNAMNDTGPETPIPPKRQRAVVRRSLALSLHRVASWLEPAEPSRHRVVVDSR